MEPDSSTPRLISWLVLRSDQATSRFEIGKPSARHHSPVTGRGASSAEWFKEIIGASHYFGPLLGCLSPGFWCVPTGHPPAAILFNLGRDIAGHRHSPMEPNQLLPAFGRDEAIPDFDLTSTSGRVAITWWTSRLNQMFGYLCDPTLFSNKHGVYDPYEHQHWLLTFGQIFGLTTALQASGRNHTV